MLGYAKFVDAMSALGLGRWLPGIWRILACILHLGNVEDTKKTTLSHDIYNSLLLSAQILDIEEDTFRKFISTPLSVPGKSSIRVLCQSLYYELVHFIIGQINEVLAPETSENPFIGLLDVGGFEVTPPNGYQQLLANTFSEWLHHFMTKKLLIEEQERYKEDGIVWENVPFTDNSPCWSLLAAPSSDTGTSFRKLFSAEFDDYLNGSGSEMALLDNMVSSIKSEDFFVSDSFGTDHEFGVVHHCGAINYCIDEFLTKNLLIGRHERLVELWKSSQLPLLKHHFTVNTTGFMDNIFEIGLSQLVKVQKYLKDAEVSFLICLKATPYWNPEALDEEYLHYQIQSHQLLEISFMKRSGYASHISFLKFFQKYDVITYTKETLARRRARGKKAHQTMSHLQTKCVDIMQHAVQQLQLDHIPSSQLYQIGATRVFLSAMACSVLDYLVFLKHEYWATEIQRIWRGYYTRKQVIAFRNEERHWAATQLQKYVRRWLAIRRYCNMFRGLTAQKLSSSSKLEKDINFWESDGDDQESEGEPKGFNSQDFDIQPLQQLPSADSGAELASAWDALAIGDNFLTLDKTQVIPKDKNFISSAMKAAELLKWFRSSLRIDTDSNDDSIEHFIQVISNGSALVNMIRKHFDHFPSVEELRITGATDYDLIVIFLDTCLTHSGMKMDHLFEIADLTENRDPWRVVECVWEYRQTMEGPKPSLEDMKPVENPTDIVPKELLKTIRKSVFYALTDFPETPATKVFGELDTSTSEAKDVLTMDISTKRASAIRALIQQEEKFMETLDVLTSFRSYMIGRKVVLTEDEIELLFGNIDQIQEFHQYIILEPLREPIDREYGKHDSQEDFESAVDRNLGESCVGDVFLNALVSDGEYANLFELYEHYMEGLPDSEAFIDRPKPTGVLKAYLEAFINSSEMGAGLPLVTYLYRPLNRLEEYEEKLVAIDRCTPEDHADKAVLSVVMTRLTNMVAEFKRKRVQLIGDLGKRLVVPNAPESRQSDLNSEALALDELIAAQKTPLTPMSDGISSLSSKKIMTTAEKNSQNRSRYLNHLRDLHDLESPMRRFICKGSVWEVINSNLVKERSLFLFNDIMIIAKEIEAGRQSPTGRFEIKSVLSLEKMYLKTSREEDPNEQLNGTPIMIKALHRFSSNPRKGITYLIEKSILSPTPPSVAHFLYRTPGLDPRQLGKFLGAPDNSEILKAFLRCFDFSGMRLDEALRIFLGTFRLSGEPKAIDLVLEAFSTAYFSSNYQSGSSPKVILQLVFSLLMLNAELHRKQDDGNIVSATLNEQERSASIYEFISKIRAIDQKNFISDQLLVEIYESIYLEKLGVAPSSEEESNKIPFKMTKLPFRLTVRKKSDPIIVSIPRPDPNLVIDIFPHRGLRAIPDRLVFRESNHAAFHLVGESLGRTSINFLKSGVDASQYDSITLPHGKTIIIEPPFMQHVFQIKARKRDTTTNKKISYMFSVANESQRHNWCQQITNALEAMSQGTTPNYGLPIISQNGTKILSEFYLSNEGAPIIPSDAKITPSAEEDPYYGVI
jgi:hypothetical protein